MYIGEYNEKVTSICKEKYGGPKKWTVYDDMNYVRALKDIVAETKEQVGKAEEEMKQDDHKAEKNVKMTKSECDPNNIATESIYSMKLDNECSVSNQSLNTFLSM